MPRSKLGAAQGGHADTVLLGGKFDVVLRSLAVAQILAQPFGGAFAFGETGVDGPVHHDFFRGERSGSGPGEGAGVVDEVAKRTREAA